MKPLYENEQDILKYFINDKSKSSTDIHSVLKKYNLSDEDKEYVDNFIKLKEILAHNKAYELGMHEVRKDVKVILQALTNLADVED